MEAATATSAASSAAALFPTSLRLVPLSGGPAVDIVADNATGYAAVFVIPVSLPLGDYNASVSNGAGGYVPFDSFLSPNKPAATSLSIVAPPKWPPGIFSVDKTSIPTWGSSVNSSDEALASALSSAAAAGGGTVLLGPGSYFLTSPIQIPPNTLLRGSGREATKITFAEWNQSTAPASALFYMNDSEASSLGGAAWGVSDLEVHITAFHNTVFYVCNMTRGWVMSRVRARVNADFASDDVNMQHNGRWLNWSWAETGPLVDVHAVGWSITYSDLYSTNVLITSYTANWQGPQDPSRHGSSYGYVARNVLWNAGEGFFFNQWQQCAVENNRISGIHLMSMGNSLGTGPGGGNVQNVYIGENSWQHVYGNDREALTGDCQGGAYYGTLASVNGTTIVTSNDTWPCDSLEWGCWEAVAVTVGNGTGMGQTRRVLVPGAGVLPSPTNRTWVIDRPFYVAPEAGVSFVEIHPYRGRVIIFGNSYADVGTVQLWQHFIETTLAENVMERGIGFISWSQFDGPYNPPPQRRPYKSTHWHYAHDDVPRTHSPGFTWTPGWQPNLRVQWLENTVTEANTMANYNYHGYYDAFMAGYRFVAMPQGYPFQYGVNAPPVNLFVVWRGNSGIGTGIWLCGGEDSPSHQTGGVNHSIVQRNSFINTSLIPEGLPCIRVDPSCERVYVADDNSCQL